MRFASDFPRGAGLQNSFPRFDGFQGSVDHPGNEEKQKAAEFRVYARGQPDVPHFMGPQVFYCRKVCYRFRRQRKPAFSCLRTSGAHAGVIIR